MAVCKKCLKDTASGHSTVCDNCLQKMVKLVVKKRNERLIRLERHWES